MAWLYALANVGVDDPYTEAPNAHAYALANVGVAYSPTDVPSGGADGENRDNPPILYALANVSVSVSGLSAFLYAFGDINTDTPTPHLWYVVPDYGQEGWQFTVVGYGLGDSQGEYSGLVKLNALTCSVVTWIGVAAEALPHTIDPTTDTADPVHQEVTAIVPAGAVSGVITIETDGP